MKGKILSLGMLLLIFGTVKAQNIVKESKKPEQLEQVVVTAQYTPTSEKNAVYKVIVIDRKTIEAKAVTNLTDLLRQELNLEISTSPIFGSGIEINGISKENIKVLIDGVPVIGRVKGVLNLNQINVDNIERVEIIEGPVSIFYGTDALGGVINLITRKDQDKPLAANVSTLYETINKKDIDLSIGIKRSTSTIQIGGGFTQFDGLNTDKNRQRSLSWPKVKRYNANLSFIQDLGAFKLHFKSMLSNELLNTLGEVKHQKAIDIDYTTKRFDNSLSFLGKLKNNAFIDLSIAYLNYDRFDTSYKYLPTDGSITLIENNANANANYFDTFFAKTHFANSFNNAPIKYAVGIEYQLDWGEGNRILDKKQKIENTSVYSSFNYNLNNKLELQPGLRFVHNSAYGNHFSPALNAKFKIDNYSSIRFAYASGFRSPNIKELYLDWHPTFGPFTYNIIGNADLRFETSNSLTLYYTMYKPKKNSKFIKFEPGIKYNVIKNLIGLSNLTNFTRQYINLHGMKTLAFDLKTEYKIKEKFKFKLGLSYLGRYLEYSETFNSGGFLFTPYANLSVNYLYRPLDISFNVYYKYNGEKKGHYIEKVNGQDVLKEAIREDFSNMDISFKKNFFDKKLNLSAGVKNLFDVKDIESFNQIGTAHERDTQLMGRTYFLKLDFKL